MNHEDRPAVQGATGSAAGGQRLTIAAAFRYSLFVIVALLLLVAVVVGTRHLAQPEQEVLTRDAEVDLGGLLVPADGPLPPAVRFRDITAEAGIDFVHHNGATGERLLPETMGGGVAFLDYNGDGHQDLLFVDSGRWPWDPEAEQARSSSLRLYENDGRGRFREVTAAAGLDDLRFYGMGLAVGDYDGDGNMDFYVTAVGSNRLFRNTGNRFLETTGTAGLAGTDDGWSTSAAFFDYDGDGFLDLFVLNYVDWSREVDFEVDYRLAGIGRAYGPPTNFRGTQSSLYRNNGDGSFSETSEEAGIHVINPATGAPAGKALALAPTDLDGDGLLDVMVANDTVRNFVFHNLGNGRFEEVGSAWGLGFDRNGLATGAMGIDAGRFRNDETLAVAIGNFANEMSSFYVSQGLPGQFADEAIVSGIGPKTRLALTFGLFFFDYDLDGRLDYLQANGHVENDIAQVQASQRYRQPGQLFWNCGDECAGTYRAVAADRIGDLARPIVGRGAAYADIDDDGRLDVILTQVAGPPLLLKNELNTGHHWLRVTLEGRSPNTAAIGASVMLDAGGQRQYRNVMPTRSYLSQVELPLTFGLGDAIEIDRLVIRWPDGEETTLTGLAPDRHHRVRQP